MVAEEVGQEGKRDGGVEVFFKGKCLEIKICSRGIRESVIYFSL